MVAARANKSKKWRAPNFYDRVGVAAGAHNMPLIAEKPILSKAFVTTDSTAALTILLEVRLLSFGLIGRHYCRSRSSRELGISQYCVYISTGSNLIATKRYWMMYCIVE